MSHKDTALAIIGNTPLIRLHGPSEATGCEILGKAEFMNPGGSVKDRAALYIIEAAEREGRLKPGGLVVEGTAGNTGIGLAVVAAAKGYRTLIVVPETQTQEKIDTLRVMGAGVELVPAKPYSDPGNFQHVAKRRAEELADSEPNGVIWAQQFDNLANREAHIKGTAQEIWKQTNGKVDAFVSCIGTGGTLSGTGMGLKEKNKDIIIALADVPGANMYNWFKSGELTGEGTSITEGIGQSRVTANLEYAPVDDQFLIPDTESLPVTFDLLKHEGLCVGASTGVNVAGAMRLAEKMGPGHTIVTMLCDSGLRYASRLFNPEFLAEKGLPVPDWL